MSSLLVIGLVVRWPNLLTSPPFPAVAHTVLAALDVRNGVAWPLTDQAPYLGAPFLYLLAAIYRLFGPSLEATMLLAWVLGALAIVPAYLLGRTLGGPIAGTIAGALLATSPAHTIISSHVPWVHSLTPLLATLSLWLLARACDRGETRSLLLAGLCIGVTLQTHPTAFPLLLGACVAAAVSIRIWRQLRLSALFLGFIILGYAPLLLHHALTQFQVIEDIQGKQARYLDADADPDERSERGVYLNNLEQLGASLIRLTAGDLQENDASATTYLRDPGLLIYPAIGIAGLLLAPRRHGWMLLAGLVAAVMLPPLLNGKYKPILDGRYLMPLVPVVFVGIGCLVSRMGSLINRNRFSPLVALLLVTVTAGLTLGSLSRLDAYYEDTTEDGASNQLYLRTLAIVREARLDGEGVWLDPRLRDAKMPAGATARSTFTWLLPVSGVPVVELPQGSESSTLAGHLAIVHRDTANELRQSGEVRYLDGSSSSGKNQPSYRVVRVEPS